MSLLSKIGIRTEKDIAADMLASHGCKGNLIEMVIEALGTIREQHQVIMSANTALKMSDEALEKMSSGLNDKSVPDEFVYSYFVSYYATFSVVGKAHMTQHAPSAEEADAILTTGGAPQRVNAMTVVNIEGGIKNWQNLVGVSHFISKSAFAGQSNVHVVISNFIELAKWPKKEAA